MALYDDQQGIPAQWSPYGAAAERADTSSAFLNGVYRHMALGLGLTGLVAMGTVQSPPVLEAVLAHPFLLVLAQFGVVMALSGLYNRISAPVATGMFYAYSALTGLMLSVIFLAYTSESIATTFFVTGGTFAAMSVWGYTTKRDLSGWGSFLIMGLIGVILASVVNIWLHSTMITWMATYIGLFIFVGLTAYDTQQIKAMAWQVTGTQQRKLAIFGALRLYLDFINLFIRLLQILGRRR